MSEPKYTKAELMTMANEALEDRTGKGIETIMRVSFATRLDPQTVKLRLAAMAKGLILPTEYKNV
jgi:hypothetical protein